jgi:hypothetical protein
MIDLGLQSFDVKTYMLRPFSNGPNVVTSASGLPTVKFNNDKINLYFRSTNLTAKTMF